MGYNPREHVVNYLIVNDLGVDIFNTNEKNTQTNLLSFIQNEK
jgi:hypothetical protein